MTSVRDLNERPRLGRVGAAAFAVGLALAGLVSCLFAAIPIATWLGYGSREVELVMVVILVLFGAMAGVLLPASWSLARYAVTGHRGPMLARGPAVVFAIVLAALLMATVVIAAWRGDMIAAAAVVVEGGALVALFVRYLLGSSAV